MQTLPAEPARLHDELEALFEKARLPTSPAIAAQILQLIADPESSAAQFARVIQADPALTMRLLKIANAARYGQRGGVKTIQRAVTVVGVRQLRLVALGFELVSHIDRLGAADFDLAAFWQQSTLRACIARELASQAVADLADEAFLVGLLQDCGMLPLAQLLGEPYGRLCREDLTPTAFVIEEQRRFDCTHAQAIAVLAGMWGLPETIVQPLGRHHEPAEVTAEATDEQRLHAVAYVVGSLPLRAADLADPAEPKLGAFVRRNLGLEQDDLQAALEASAVSFAEFGELFRDTLKLDMDVTPLLQEANRQLSCELERAHRQVDEAESQRDDVLDEQSLLRSALGRYHARAARDPLTGLLNRGAIMEAGTECMRAAERDGAPLTVLFLDLDDFKRINARFGHERGDAVLRCVAARMRLALSGHASIGRFGGEEFVAFLAGPDEATVRRCVERGLQSIREGVHKETGLPDPITASAGAVWTLPAGGLSPQTLLTRADELMCRSREGGGDACCFRVLPGPSPPENAAEAAPMSEEEIRRVAEMLAERQSALSSEDRKQPRHPVFRPCRLVLLGRDDPAPHHMEAFVRNLSGGGMGALVPRPMVRGDLVEVSVDAGERILHLAGVVAFCRQIRDDLFDVGVQLTRNMDGERS